MMMDMKQELATISLVLKLALTASLFRAFSLVVIVLIMDLLLDIICSFRFSDWWIFRPKSFSVSTGLILQGLRVAQAAVTERWP